MITTCNKCGGLIADTGEFYAGRACDCPPLYHQPPMNLETQATLAPATLLDCLRRMRRGVQKRTNYYQQKQDDPYQINTGLLVAMLELDGILGDEINYLERQSNVCMSHGGDNEQ